MGDPWAVLIERPEMQLLTAGIPERGRYYHRLRTIVLRKGLSLVEQRATLWHELVHAERGDEHCGEKSEARVDREAARRAIDIHDLADALLWSEHLSEQADQLKTTEAQLLTRLNTLHPAERGYLRRRLEQIERPA